MQRYKKGKTKKKMMVTKTNTNFLHFSTKRKLTKNTTKRTKCKGKKEKKRDETKKATTTKAIYNGEKQKKTQP